MELDLTGKNAATAGSGNGGAARKSRGFESWTTTTTLMVQVVQTHQVLLQMELKEF